MTKKDTLHRFIFDKAPVRGEYIHLEQSYQTIVSQHNYPDSVRKLLGEALCVAGLLSAIIKFDGRLTVQFRGKGNLKFLLAQCDNLFNIRGLAKWDGDVSYEELMTSFNDGVLVIMLDSGPSKRYQGIVAWENNSFIDSIQAYFRQSEQLATKLWLGVSQTAATGMLLQVVPGKNQDAVGIESEIIQPHWEAITKCALDLTSEELMALDYPELLQQIYPEEDIRLFPEVPVQFNCTCSRKRGEDAIQILGREEADAELANHNSIVVTCEFCNKEYVFDRIDVATIFENKDVPPKTQLH